jgi:hypothetical protein
MNALTEAIIECERAAYAHGAAAPPATEQSQRNADALRQALLLADSAERELAEIRRRQANRSETIGWYQELTKTSDPVMLRGHINCGRVVIHERCQHMPRDIAPVPAALTEGGAGDA